VNGLDDWYFRPVKLAPLTAIALLLMASPALAARAHTSVVGGSDTSIAAVPWQAAVLDRATSDPYVALHCGGSIRDTTHVITAAHCVHSISGVPQPASKFDVLVGATDLVTPLEAGAQRIHVSAIAFDPRYDTATWQYDSAILTLAQPITTGAATWVGLGDPGHGDQWDGLGGDLGRISGWGATDSNGSTYPQRLQAASVPLVPGSTCAADYGSSGDVDPATMVCAGDTVHGGVDTCQGDSGGPLTVQDPAYTRPRLVGITSFGVNCAEASHPGVYTRVAEASIASFLRSNGPAAPAPGGAPALSGTAAVGQTLTCQSPSWTNGPTLDYQFERLVGSTAIAVTTAQSGPAYAVRDSDAGSALRCVVRGENPGGYAEVRSALSAVVPASGSITVRQPAGTQALPPPGSGVDVVAPRARILSGRCTRARCVLKVSVSDARPSSGVKGLVVQATRTVTRRCRRHGRSTTCTSRSVRSLHATRAASGRYTIVLSRPRSGRYRFAVLAVDRAGNRQARAVRRTLQAS
jgi:V8-like Glu-specific endopeptidase